MCCFSQPILSVSATNIFARDAPDGRQYLAYGMTLNAARDLAMILPLPVAPGAGEDALEFIDLSGYPNLFEDMVSEFPAEECFSVRFAAEDEDLLEVVRVGSFDASFVPRAADFGRLDPRFRIPAETWAQVPGYEAYGFAVFKLGAGEHVVHPMAFTFPRARPEALFFPTLHIHDGRVHPSAHFDHALFRQSPARAKKWLEDWEWNEQWDQSRTTRRVDAKRTGGLVDPAQPLFRRVIEGHARNADVWYGPPPVGAPAPARVTSVEAATDEGGAFGLFGKSTNASVEAATDEGVSFGVFGGWFSPTPEAEPEKPEEPEE